MKDSFDVLLIDPPFLSRECFEKVSHLVEFIGKKTPSCKHIICTGMTFHSLFGRQGDIKIALF
jgi:16S rRNA G966 N2-methylase RsmD